MEQRGRPPQNDWRSCERCKRCGDPVLQGGFWWCAECYKVTGFLQSRRGLTMIQIAASGEDDYSTTPMIALLAPHLGYAKQKLDQFDIAGAPTSASIKHGVACTVKRCSRCDIVKDRADFTLNRRDRTGLNPWCKACHSAYRREKYLRKQSEFTSQRAVYSPA